MWCGYKSLKFVKYNQSIFSSLTPQYYFQNLFKLVTHVNLCFPELSD